MNTTPGSQSVPGPQAAQEGTEARGLSAQALELAAERFARSGTPARLARALMARLEITNRFHPSGLFAAVALDLGRPNLAGSPFLGVALELLHLSSLIHDDVVDLHERRWHLPAIRSELGTAAAVLGGDICFGLALQFALEAVGETGATVLPALFAHAGVTIACAQQEELERSETPATKRVYENIAARKTYVGHLAVEAAASGSGVTAADLEALLAFRRSLGVSSQIANDLSELDGVRGFFHPLPVGRRGEADEQRHRLTVFAVREIAEAQEYPDAARDAAISWYASLVRDAEAALDTLGRPAPRLRTYLKRANPIWLRPM